MNIERICTLLASGIKIQNVASIVGCSPARISQLAKDSTEFQNLLAAKTAEMNEKDIEEVAITSKYHAAEHALLDQVLAMAPVAELRDVTAALRVVAERQDKAKTRLNPIQGSHSVVNNVIQIGVPMHALPEIHLTKDMEVISVNNMNLAPLTSEGVTNLFKNMRSMKEINHEQRRIPAVTEEVIGEAPLSEEALAFLDSREDIPSRMSA